MTYDLLAVGGTGQWFLLDLVLRVGQQEGAGPIELPKKCWVADRDFELTEPEGVASTLNTEYNRLKRVHFPDCVAKPALQKDVKQIRRLPDLTLESDLLYPALTFEERETEVDRGFHALPRLAATWVSMHGFHETKATAEVAGQYLPSCFTDKNLFATDSGPLVIVGSLSGGTGAGLLPYLFRQARRGDPQNWQRPIVLIAVLPWFNPEEVREKKITWNDVCLNASFGVRALFRVMRALRAKAVPDPPGSAWTRCVFTGPDLDVTSSQGPYDPKTRVREGSVAPVMRSLVLTLPRLVAEPNAQIARPPFEFGAIQIQTAFYTPDTDKPGRMELSVDEAANAYAALRARTLADEPWQNASWAPGRITRIGGLGRTLGGSLVLSVSMSVKDKDLRQHFFEGFSSSLKKYSDLHLDRITNGEFSVTKASELHSIIQNVDSEATKKDRSSLAIKGDLKNLSPEEAKIKGKESADIIFKILQRDASRCFGENPTGAAKRMKRLTVKSRRLLPSSSDVIGDAGIFPDFCPFSIIDETAESNSLSNKYATEARLGTALQSRSYATLLSLSHVLADRIEAYEGEPSADTKLSHLILLWRAALHGKLERKPLADRRKNEANLTESMQLDFPEPVLFSVNGIALGFSSADVGFVPHADWLEDGVRPSSNGASLKSCTAPSSLDTG